MPTTSFTQMTVWQKAHKVTMEIYRITKNFPTDERYGLSAEMRKTARSVPANLAEGYGRTFPKDKVRFYNISQGSTEELKCYCILARDLGYTKEFDALWSSLEEISRMLRGLCTSILNA
jgi:four helix bundle protein